MPAGSAQLAEQQSSATAQTSPLGRQAAGGGSHIPPVPHLNEQQSSGAVHEVPFGKQPIATQRLLMQDPEQQSASAVHAHAVGRHAPSAQPLASPVIASPLASPPDPSGAPSGVTASIVPSSMLPSTDPSPVPSPSLQSHPVTTRRSNGRTRRRWQCISPS
jgi:hypothetical protein